MSKHMPERIWAWGGVKEEGRWWQLGPYIDEDYEAVKYVRADLYDKVNRLATYYKIKALNVTYYKIEAEKLKRELEELLPLTRCMWCGAERTGPKPPGRMVRLVNACPQCVEGGEQAGEGDSQSDGVDRDTLRAPDNPQPAAPLCKHCGCEQSHHRASRHECQNVVETLWAGDQYEQVYCDCPGYEPVAVPPCKHCGYPGKAHTYVEHGFRCPGYEPKGEEQ